MLTKNDIKQIELKGLTEQDIKNQIDHFKNGFPFVNVLRPATVDDGILKLNTDEIQSYEKLFKDLNPDVIKFVPASGAATRMFKFLFEFYAAANDRYNGIQEIKNADVRRFFEHIEKFAFYNDLRQALENHGFDLISLLKEGKYKQILKYFLFDEGLNYGQKPKGVLCFHSYSNGVRTAFEEHLIEGAEYCQNTDGKVKIHFTISNEHKDLFKDLTNAKVKAIENKYSIHFEISFSQQKASTDIVAVDSQNKLFRNKDNSLLFRPGGHGALIENLNDLDADIIFIKNIDNVVPDSLKTDTILYKKALAGVLLSYQERIFGYLHILESGKCDGDKVNEIKDFIENNLCYRKPGKLSKEELFTILNRPIRVCGMVKNEGEPGGGPFWVKQKNAVENLQVVETAQIDLTKIENKELLNKASHFNPVDLICATKDFKDKKFNLLKYRDINTGFISKKSQNGKELKAQELPGLWNGAMANWNTIFVEVPITTFNPVKTVNDLLRKEHQ